MNCVECRYRKFCRNFNKELGPVEVHNWEGLFEPDFSMPELVNGA